MNSKVKRVFREYLGSIGYPATGILKIKDTYDGVEVHYTDEYNVETDKVLFKSDLLRVIHFICKEHKRLFNNEQEHGRKKDKSG